MIEDFLSSRQFHGFIGVLSVTFLVIAIYEKVKSIEKMNLEIKKHQENEN